ncbi:MAG: CatB-related O-acetyltransferase [Candidatus Caenarcaniphilales bacterium]|nr:CatB-related O-acetyltransferase [Candidatus Caenarcaniphilales bacterium]
MLSLDSKKIFLLDNLIRREFLKDSIYSLDIESLEDFYYQSCNSNKDFYDLYSKVYDQILNYLQKNSYLKCSSKFNLASSVSYHLKFGWVLSHGNSKAFLGKFNVPSCDSIKIGRYSYLSSQVVFSGRGEVEIGQFSSIGDNIHFVSSNINHASDLCSTYELGPSPRVAYTEMIFEDFLSKSSVDSSLLVANCKVGNDVWIGKNVTVMNGVEIGNGCIIGMNSVVTKKCEPYGLYAGTPAKLIRFRFNEKTINQLLEIKWWDWDIRKIKKENKMFSTSLSSDLDLGELIS